MTELGWYALVCIVSAIVSVAGAGAAAFWAARSWPIGMREVADDVSERVDALDAKWARRAAELAALGEEISGVLDAVETRRRRIAASESRAAAREGSPPGADGGLPADPNERRKAITERARAQGFRV